MERGRILILGNSKESTYEIRSLLDNKRFEVEIALSPEVGKAVLSTRQMSLVMVHTEMLKQEDLDFMSFLKDRLERTPLAVLGEEATSREDVLTLSTDVGRFNKPYQSEDLITFIESL